MATSEVVLPVTNVTNIRSNNKEIGSRVIRGVDWKWGKQVNT